MSENTTPPSETVEDLPPAIKAWRARRDHMAAIEITRTLHMLDAAPNQDRDRNKWKILGVGNILVKGQSWMNGNTNQDRGFGSVRLVMHALSVDEKQALAWMCEKFPEEAAEAPNAKPVKSEDDEDKPAPVFSPPDPVPDSIPDVSGYLINSRHLPPSLVAREIKAGRIYATRHFDFKERQYTGESQCVFIGPASAEIRSVLADGFKGCCPGSDPDALGYRVLPIEPVAPAISISEAAIDALSRHVLDPHCYSISTNGSGRFRLHHDLTMEAYRNGFQTRWSFDADAAGDLAAQLVFNALYLRETLSAQYEVSPDQIDEWVMSNAIRLVVNKDEQEQVFISSKAEKPRLNYMITRTTGRLKRGENTVEPSWAEIDAVLAKYNVIRDRPQNAKDWNEIVKNNAAALTTAYEAKISGSVPASVVKPEAAPAAPAARPSQRFTPRPRQHQG